jgi:hypothetical protein
LALANRRRPRAAAAPLRGEPAIAASYHTLSLLVLQF